MGLQFEEFEAGEMPFIEYPGWNGAFTRGQAANALPNGTTIEKAQGEEGDGTPLGTRGVVLGSFSHPKVLNGETLYFVEWANRPRWAVAVIAWKLRPAS